ncbi:plasmid partitioning/stability family protein [Phytobacter diazotrophicus]|uniref:plasmid partitioning/stability family protein n=1 Tax=Phytobacter diazotrophicus TaxID=395631 RepID=UPI001C99A463|nr:plasmid partitioning/stability family protein [Phytobacter diazotrophicus]MBY6260069.1 plasmid partitioning/stability family protein [Phytobacter diazotrophicus]
MSDDRKKFTLYLHPKNEADQQAMNVIETVSRSDRGELFRNVFVAGLALQQIDKRLPAMLATLFTEVVTTDQLVALISQTTGWKPSQAHIRDVLAELNIGNGTFLQTNKSEPEHQDEVALNAARKKLQGLI